MSFTRLIRVFSAALLITRAASLSLVPRTVPPYIGSYHGFDPEGCVIDNALSYKFAESDSMTEEICIDTCDAAGFFWAGLTKGNQCWCGNINRSQAATIDNCMISCSGAQGENCGGNNHYLVYRRFVQPQVVQQYKDWTTVSSCYTDDPSARALHHLAIRDDTVTVSKCLDACEADGFALAGVEYYNECWCGNSIQYDNHPQSIFNCQYPCAGDPHQLCGGSNSMIIYQRGIPYTVGPVTTLVQSYNNYHLTQCWQDDKYLFGGQRLLQNEPNPPLPHEEVTVQKCIDACAQSGYTSAGLEWSQECFCGNISFPPGQSTSPGDCNMPCTADATQYCGGPNRLLIYTST
jgi:hypothetical protein